MTNETNSQSAPLTDEDVAWLDTLTPLSAAGQICRLEGRFPIPTELVDALADECEAWFADGQTASNAARIALNIWFPSHEEAEVESCECELDSRCGFCGPGPSPLELMNDEFARREDGPDSAR